MTKRMNRILWIAQGLLALLFVFGGVTKLIMPAEELTRDTTLPAAFLRFIGVCEALGGLGLVLPGMLKIKTGLTPLAASGLVIIMIGATTVTLMGPMAAAAPIPAGVGALLAFVAYRRWRPSGPRRPISAVDLASLRTT
jgi:hypothetical protein